MTITTIAGQSRDDQDNQDNEDNQDNHDERQRASAEVKKAVAVLSAVVEAAAASVPRVDQVKAGAICLKIFHQAIFSPIYCKFTGVRRTGLEKASVTKPLPIWSNAMTDLKVDATITTKKEKEQAMKSMKLLLFFEVGRDLKV